MDTTFIDHKFNIISTQLAEDRYIEVMLMCLVALLYFTMYNELNNLRKRMIDAVADALNESEAKTKQCIDKQERAILELSDMVHTDHFACIDREKRLREEVERTTKKINVLKECVLGLMNGSPASQAKMMTCIDEM